REAVVAERLERRRLPAALAGLAVADARAEHLVPVAEDVGGDDDALAERSLDRVAAAVEERRDVLDPDPARLPRRGWGHCVTPNDARSGPERIGFVVNRSSGVLLHPTSLPGGRLGEEAFR